MQLLIKRPITILLLLVTTIAIVTLTVIIAGKSYGKIDPIPFEDLRHLAHRIAQRPISTQILSVIVVPIIGNILLFVTDYTNLRADDSSRSHILDSNRSVAVLSPDACRRHQRHHLEHCRHHCRRNPRTRAIACAIRVRVRI